MRRSALALMVDDPPLIRRPRSSRKGKNAQGLIANPSSPCSADARPRRLQGCSRPQASAPCPDPRRAGVRPMTVAVKPALSPAEIALAYHARTKHSLERYAAGPETLDWDAQPNPFREFAGCARTPLPLTADRLATQLRADLCAAATFIRHR